MKKAVIIGCPRSGQRRIHAAFGHAKLTAAYEQDKDGAIVTVSWMLSADGDDYLRQHDPWWNRATEEVWHNVRHPLRCIPSMAARLSSNLLTWQFPYTGLHPANPVFPNRRMFAANFWVKWQLLAEARKPSWQFRVEDLEDGVWEEMWERLGEPLRPLSPKAALYRHVDKEAKMTPIEPMAYDEIKSWSPSVCDDVRRMAARYGYSDED